jgi:Ribosomal protein S7e
VSALMAEKSSKCTSPQVPFCLRVGVLTFRFLDSKDSSSLDYKLDSFSSVYNKLTGKTVEFEFPIQQGEGL